MKRVVLALMDDWIQVAIGKPGGSARVKLLCQEPLEHTGDAVADWEKAARTLWEKYRLPRKHVLLVLPGSGTSVRSLSLPPMGAKKLPQAVQDELQSREERELVTDYIQIERERSGARRVLACACPREDMRLFLDMAKRLGFKLDGVTVPMGPVLNLLRATREMRGQTCIWLWLDGETLTSMLVEKGAYAYAWRSRIYSDPGTANFATEITRNVSGALQFCAAERMDALVTTLYYAGCSDSDFEVCRRGVEELGLRVERLPRCGRIRAFPPGREMAEWLSCTGAMLN